MGIISFLVITPSKYEYMYNRHKTQQNKRLHLY